ncbi:hypothetical protein [Streptomyces sp. NRRL B-11253]|uniref:hypothetical protein n=1 Tax=Streptomyces sp. NRRL B-11253 TaxID=1463826 RepID=UPI00051905B6|nr:hypothetical protein [Streptomyces sp. NRRL B-11253]
MKKQTPAERLATIRKNTHLATIAKRSAWDQHIVEQAIFLYGTDHDTFSANDLRDLLPEQGCGFLGAAVNSLRQAGVIEHTRQYVPSTSPATHGHPIAVWRLSVKGLVIAEKRAARTERRSAA